MMKKWNAPKMVELNIAATANGFWDVDWEGPFNVVFGEGKDGNDDGDKSDDKTNLESGN